MRRKNPCLSKVEQKPRDFVKFIFVFTRKEANLMIYSLDTLKPKTRNQIFLLITFRLYNTLKKKTMCIKKSSNFHLHNKKQFGFQYLVFRLSNGLIICSAKFPAVPGNLNTQQTCKSTKQQVYGVQKYTTKSLTEI